MPIRKQSTLQKRQASESPRAAALRILKVRREMTVVELTRTLKLTETAVRRHLQKLQRDGLVEMHMRSQQKGRPTHVFRLTQKATTDYFPTGYEELAARTLDTIFDTDGHRGVFNFLLASNQHLISVLEKQVLNTPLRERVKFLADHFTKNGYMTDFRELPEERFFLFHQNCAIYNLANRYRQLCFVELKLIETLSAAKVTRRQYIFKNQAVCGYLIEPRSV